MPKKIQAKWLRVTEEINAIDYLEKAVGALEETLGDKMAWKWVCLNLFSATYAFAICAIKGTNPARVMTINGRKLIDFTTAIQRAQDPNWANRHILQLSSDQSHSLSKLRKEFRNNFEHYQPLLWSIELHAFAEIVPDTLDVIRQLALEVGGYPDLHFSPIQKRVIRSLLWRANRIIRQHPIFLELSSI